ncbi:unnamed protein product [Mytilus coruscus]|uniref:Endonuclease/exonuclease/phosphatase domain-containing protein n=1 Tax=Mytilus coruscus TaxID=42192 RepID=A0A6J8AM88_MYTCO|nr:unnamed protein product [Mytilus coruscus]
MDTQFDKIINQFNENVNNTSNSQPTNQRNTRCADNSDIRNDTPIMQESPMTGFAPTSNTTLPRDSTKPTITCPTPTKMTPQQSELRILSFNCKNVKTIAPFIENMRNQVDIILLQEHWLFPHELNLLDELNSHFCGKGKSIDSGKNTCELMIKSVRGYGVSAYLPTKAENDKFEEFSECIDQLFEIIQKYELTHNLVTGGDFNEDISKINNSRKVLKLEKLIDECNMKVDFKGPTFINVKGEEISEIDYFIYKTEVIHKTSKTN